MNAAPQPYTRHAAVDHALFGFLPLLATVWLVHTAFSHGVGAVDFRGSFYVAGHRTLHGGDPYAWTSRQILAGFSFPYPSLAALLFVPMALVPAGVASALFTGICLLSVPAALAVLRVRDWRVYGLVLLWSPVVVGWQTGNLSLLILLGLACAWRWRGHAALLGLLVAAMVSIKPIVAPLALWLLLSRRYAACGWAVAFGLALGAVSWTVVGWSALGEWLHLVARQGDLLFGRGYAIVALGSDVGVGHQTGLLISLAVAAAVAGGCVWRRHELGERGIFAIAVVLMLIVSPQVDSHYFALLIAPLALFHDRLSRVWGLPVVLWLCPAADAAGWQAMLWWLVVVGVSAAGLRAGWQRRTPAPAGAETGSEFSPQPVLIG
jgi:alpha-1,2-mannosyltransferase